MTFGHFSFLKHCINASQNDSLIVLKMSLLLSLMKILTVVKQK